MRRPSTTERTGPLVVSAGLLVVLATGSACSVDVDYSNTEFRCPDGACPSGFECVESRCVAPDGLAHSDAGHDAAGAVDPVDARPPTDDPSARGLRGTYYDDVDLASEAFTRIDPTVDFDWDHESPDPSVDKDTFSVRWRGSVIPRFSETYTFHLVSDDHSAQLQ